MVEGIRVEMQCDGICYNCLYILRNDTMGHSDCIDRVASGLNVTANVQHKSSRLTSRYVEHTLITPLGAQINYTTGNKN